MSRLVLLVNPTAGGGRGARIGPRTARALRARGHDVHVLATSPAGPGEVAPDVAAALVGRDALVVVGGDGTVHAGAQATAGTGVPLGIVPAGSGDDIARTLGLPRRPDDVVATLARALDRGPRRVDAVLAGPPGGADPRAAARDPRAAAGDPGVRQGAVWYVGVLSCGFDAAVSARANAMRLPLGRARYLGGIVAELRTFTPYGYRLTLDDPAGDVVWESGGTLVAAANAPRFGGGIAIAPDARMTDGLLDVVVAGPVTRRGVVAVLPGAYRGRHVRHPAVRVLRTRSVLVEADTRLGPPPPVAFADGERLGPLPLRATVVPGALHVLA